MTHFVSGDRQLGENPAVAQPRHEDRDGQQETESAADPERNPVECDGAVEEQIGVEEQESDRRKRRDPAPPRRTGHRTGWRRAGRTMNGAFAPAPSAPIVWDSSSTSAPRYFTT